MQERDDETPPGATPDDPTPEADAPDARDAAASSAGPTRPSEPTTDAPGAPDEPTAGPAGPDDPTTPHEPAFAGRPGGDPPGGVPPAGGGDGGAAEPERPRRLYRSRRDRMIAGVCGGLADHFGIDAVIVRVIAVALVFAGGAGAFLYVAAWLLVPEEGPDDEPAPAGRVATVAGVVALVVALGILLPFWGGPFDHWGWGGPFLSLVVIGLAGLVIWRLASGERGAGDPASAGTRDLLRRVGLGVSLIALSALLAIGGAWATVVGGGTAVAVVIIVAGLWLVAGAFLGGARWLIVPALALALPAGAVSAANIDAEGGVGEREYRPLAVQDVRDTYRLGIGRLVVDLRDTDLPPGDHRLRIDVGIGEAWVVVPRDVCVASRAEAGAGQITVFDRGSGGVDVDWDDVRRAPAGTTRLVLDGDIGVGVLQVSHDDPDRRDRRRHDGNLDPGNGACIGGSRG